MQVSNLDTAPPSGTEKDVSKPATAASDAFAILLQNSFAPQINPGLLRLADASGLAQRVSTGRDNLAEARPTEDTDAGEPVEFDDEDSVAAPDEVAEDSRDDDADATVRPAETPLLLVDARLSPESRISPNGATAAIAAADGQSGAVSQQRAALPQVAVETAVGAASSPSTDAAAKSGNADSPKNTGADGRLPATITESGQQLLSRPANTLAAAATLAAQTGKAGGPDATVTGNAPGTPGAAGNLLLSDSGGRAMYQGNGQRGASQSAPTNAATPPDIAANTGNSSAAFAASLASNQSSPPPAAAKPLPGLDRAAGTLPLAPAALGGQTPSGAARPGAAPPPSRPTPPPPGALRGQIAVQVQRAVAQGVDRINIQLKPAELGRLEIKLEIAQDGRVSALVTVERPDTLELLQKDSRGLQQALQDAGLKTDSSGLNFNLRGGDTAPREQSADSGGAADRNGAETASGDEVAEDQDQPARRQANDSLIDVEV